MRIIKAPNLASAHEQVVRMILEKGWILTTEDQEATVEFEEVTMRIEHPTSSPMVSPKSRFQQRFMDHYARDLIKGSDSTFEYDYHDRLFNWGKTCSAVMVLRSMLTRYGTLQKKFENLLSAGGLLQSPGILHTTKTLMTAPACSLFNASPVTVSCT